MRTQQQRLLVQLLSQQSDFRPCEFHESQRTRNPETLRVNRRLDRESQRRGHRQRRECCNLSAALEVSFSKCYRCGARLENRTCMRAPAYTVVPGKGICSIAAPDPMDCNRKPAFKQSCVTSRRDFPPKSGTTISPKSASEPKEPGLKSATTYLGAKGFLDEALGFSIRSRFGFTSCFTVYCGAYDGASGGTDMYRKIGSATLLKIGAATSPPMCCPAGSSMTTMMATTGLEAGANPAKDATNFVLE